MSNDIPDKSDTPPTDVQAPTAPPRDFTPLALCLTVVVLCLLDAIVTGLVKNTSSGLVGGFLMGAMIIQLMLVGIWTALGPGSILFRLPIVIPFVLLLCVLPAHVVKLSEKKLGIEAIAFLVAAYTIFVASILIFQLFRRFGRLRLVTYQQWLPESETCVRFSIKHLLILITIYAVVLALTTPLKPQMPPAGSLPPWLNQWTIILVGLAYGLIIVAAILPSTVGGLAVLYGALTPTAVTLSAVNWILFNVVIVALISYSAPPADVLGEIMSVILGAQFGALLAGLAIVAPLRAIGLRLIRLTRPYKPSPAAIAALAGQTAAPRSGDS